MMSGDETILTFKFLTLPLFRLDAEKYVREHIACMYPLLPTMQGTNRALIKQVLDELATLYRDDEVTLAQQIVWMNLLLDRTTTLPVQEKRAIREELQMFDQLWNESPTAQKKMAESRAAGLAEGKSEGRSEGQIEALQKMIVMIVSARFPALGELAQQAVMKTNSLSALELLTKQIAIASDEATLRQMLLPFAD
jgi:hypothetical protein